MLSVNFFTFHLFKFAAPKFADTPNQTYLQKRQLDIQLGGQIRKKDYLDSEVEKQAGTLTDKQIRRNQIGKNN